MSLFEKKLYEFARKYIDLYDSSGINFHYSTQLPKYEAAMMKLGDPLVKLLNQPVGRGLSQHVFECPPGCTRAFLNHPNDENTNNTETVTVFREKLHMHQSGRMMFTEHYRASSSASSSPSGGDDKDGQQQAADKQLFRTARAQFFDFE
jgi:hypothetical protein